MMREELERALATRAYKGYKVFLNWFGDDYGERTIEDMLGPVEMEPADRRRLIVLLHVPRAGRLADPVIQEGVRTLARGLSATPRSCWPTAGAATCPTRCRRRWAA